MVRKKISTFTTLARYSIFGRWRFEIRYLVANARNNSWDLRVLQSNRHRLDCVLSNKVQRRWCSNFIGYLKSLVFTWVYTIDQWKVKLLSLWWWINNWLTLRIFPFYQLQHIRIWIKTWSNTGSQRTKPNIFVEYLFSQRASQPARYSEFTRVKQLVVWYHLLKSSA